MVSDQGFYCTADCIAGRKPIVITVHLASRLEISMMVTLGGLDAQTSGGPACPVLKQAVGRQVIAAVSGRQCSPST